MVAAERFEVRVGPDAIEGAVELARELAFDLEIEGVALFAPRCVVAGQVWVGCVVHRALPPNRGLEYSNLSIGCQVAPLTPDAS